MPARDSMLVARKTSSFQNLFQPNEQPEQIDMLDLERRVADIDERARREAYDEQIDMLDLERRVADLEERARREDRAEAAKDRLRVLGLVFNHR